VRDLNNPVELDPENKKMLHAAAITYCLLRDYKKAREMLDRSNALHPNEHDPWEAATWDLVLRADPSAIHRLAQQSTGDDYDVVVTRLRLALTEHDPAAAERALARLETMGETTIDARSVGITRLSRSYLEGLVDRMKGDIGSATDAFQKARSQQADAVSFQPNNGPTLCVLGLIDAALGRKPEALREGQHALELTPAEKDSLDAADVVYYDAVICAWVGERDLAIKQLETSARMPGGVTYAEIRLDPEWDPLRSDPRFEKIAASLKP
jgi:tetratricopeptide (TPR) repeat protein